MLNLPATELSTVDPTECPKPEVDMDAARAAFLEHGPSDLVKDIGLLIAALGLHIPNAT